ncbi:hypothetical protein [Sulfurospirillum barnesii]|uniref:Uncharacterized protein n=1 Tax=Sulfurospirillum barnesii (strain ATCC 700032 / DSM 10660 / SES-3) TaxID=760154 RepID=I3XV54_SULBS|nr:hypothetical protein [Sulfurospirillum barnesii]AFL67828.1 hypothetical protein Sulba_0511 [Sulfurospirillum barnesii SES-3]
MKIIKESNISRIIIVSTIFIISALMLFNGYFFISKQYEILEVHIADTKRTFVENKQQLLKREVDAIIEFIAFKKKSIPLLDAQKEEALKQEVYRWIRHIRYGDQEHNYIFVYQVIDIEGGGEICKNAHQS